MIKYIGKCLFIKIQNEKILVVGDLHLGFERVLRASGVMLPLKIVEEILEDFEKIFEKIKRVDKVILLGDVKHDFGKNEIDEYKEIGRVINFLRTKTNEIIIIKGNHDKVLENVVKNVEKIKLNDFFIWKDFAFLHGDRDFKEIYEKNIKFWVVGHAHPAINLSDGTKIEKYKCFLVGDYKKKKVIIVPSFFSIGDGSDPREFDLGLFWKFNLENFEVKIVSNEEIKVFDFGKLKKLI